MTLPKQVAQGCRDCPGRDHGDEACGPLTVKWRGVWWCESAYTIWSHIEEKFPGQLEEQKQGISCYEDEEKS